MLGLKFSWIVIAAVLGMLLAPLAFAEVDYKWRTLAEWQVQLRDPAPEIRQQAAVALGSFGVQAVPALIHALGDSNNLVGVRAMSSLIKIGPDAVPGLGLALRDRDRNVVNSSAEA